MRILAIDPGATGAGYCVWSTETNSPMAIADCLITNASPDAIVVESGFIGKMGRQAMWGLGFDAGWRLHEAWLANFAIGPALYTIRPDGVNGWRAALPERSGFKKFDGLPGDVIVARLRARYDFSSVPGSFDYHTEHEVEACGIAEAAAAILQRPTRLARKALKAVKR